MCIRDRYASLADLVVLTSAWHRQIDRQTDRQTEKLCSLFLGTHGLGKHQKGWCSNLKTSLSTFIWLCYLALSDVISMTHSDNDMYLGQSLAFQAFSEHGMQMCCKSQAVVSCPIKFHGGELPSAVLYTDWTLASKYDPSAHQSKLPHTA